MALNLENQQRIVDMRGRVLRGEDVSPEELRDIINIIRESRGAAKPSAKSNGGTKRKAPVVVDLDALFAKAEGSK